ncbi:methylated-DNA--[protein]-cysteine S-methyltransferase [Sporolituus thermophilus]|uniref:Methylated-DNA--protein-cysteine methyltransferase n=1 Tax=Sporolituus thermophilus DSM 23256 TaxID=1123285 RepID=A0A1G7J3G9_9FIRM|nr:methylated-DNA--[protein]-cysteine S-methyltransferase [Sporolituus thermophilus]SDF19416.1 methylated-DNA-[protein]-cysteine S-methyltransferase [Sporolituus thermophilus DSM 23256]
MIVYDAVQTPLGPVYVAVDDIGVCKVAIDSRDWQEYIGSTGCQRDSARCDFAIRQLKEYFLRQRRRFDVPLSIAGTDFCRRVWEVLSSIPYGEVRTYADIAAAIGQPQACRAVGLANFKNPLPIFIPCHRVVGKNGGLVGYKGARTDFKRYLLQLENALTPENGGEMGIN